MPRSIRQLLTCLALATLALPCLGATATAPVRHTVRVDAHPIAVWEKSAADDADRAVLLVHGRTWSARPDFDLQVEGEHLSLMDALVEAGFAVYAIDLRGYGESPRDSTGWLTPQRAADDVVAVLRWIHQRHGDAERPHLFGWSMGSTISQLAAQGHPDAMASLTLYGYWHDPDDRFPEAPTDQPPARLENTAEAAASDFITPGSISQRAIDAFVEAALTTDPVKTDIRRLTDYNRLDPAEVSVPTLVIAGEFDPLAPQDHLAKLYVRLGTGHKQWVSVPGGDHAAHLEAPREYFVRELVAFMRGVPD
ncbi:MAG: alpha/beta fold hydrolase [Pseudomonadota bacterium]